MKKKSIVFISIIGIIILIIAIFLLNTNNILKSKEKIEILDATHKCANSLEQFYEDDKYVYFFPCVQSKSIYVKFENGNKMLVVDALEEEKITINKLIKAGLKVHKEKK